MDSKPKPRIFHEMRDKRTRSSLGNMAIRGSPVNEERARDLGEALSGAYKWEFSKGSLSRCGNELTGAIGVESLSPCELL